MESKYSILESARLLGRSKNTVKYWVRKLPPETISKDENGRLWISSDGLELLRGHLETVSEKVDEHNHQEPDERTTDFPAEPPRTGRKPPKNHLQPDEEPDEKPLSTGRKPDEEPPTTTQRTTDADQLDELRRQLERLRLDLDTAREQRDKEEKRAAVAAAERDAERRRADGAEQREQQHLQTVKDLTAALQSEQQHAAELTVLLQTANEQLTAALALNAGQIQLAMQQSEPATVTADSADDQPGDDQRDTGSTRTPNEHRDTAADQQTDTKTGDGADDQSTGKRRGFFARLFGRKSGGERGKK